MVLIPQSKVTGAWAYHVWLDHRIIAVTCIHMSFFPLVGWWRRRNGFHTSSLRNPTNLVGGDLMWFTAIHVIPHIKKHVHVSSRFQTWIICWPLQDEGGRDHRRGPVDRGAWPFGDGHHQEIPGEGALSSLARQQSGSKGYLLVIWVIDES